MYITFAYFLENLKLFEVKKKKVDGTAASWFATSPETGRG